MFESASLHAYVALLALAGASVAACGGGGAPESTTRSRTIGAAGGSLAVGGLTLTLPGGALASDHTITLTTLDEAGPATLTARSRVYALEPSGLELAAPAEVRLALDRGAGDAWIYHSRRGGRGFVRLRTSVTNGEARAAVRHFSEVFGAAPPACSELIIEDETRVDLCADASSLAFVTLDSGLPGWAYLTRDGFGLVRERVVGLPEKLEPVFPIDPDDPGTLVSADGKQRLIFVYGGNTVGFSRIKLMKWVDIDAEVDSEGEIVAPTGTGFFGATGLSLFAPGGGMGVIAVGQTEQGTGAAHVAPWPGEASFAPLDLALPAPLLDPVAVPVVDGGAVAPGIVAVESGEPAHVVASGGLLEAPASFETIPFDGDARGASLTAAEGATSRVELYIFDAQGGLALGPSEAVARCADCTLAPAGGKPLVRVADLTGRGDNQIVRLGYGSIAVTTQGVDGGLSTTRLSAPDITAPVAMEVFGYTPQGLSSAGGSWVTAGALATTPTRGARIAVLQGSELLLFRVGCGTNGPGPDDVADAIADVPIVGDTTTTSTSGDVAPEVADVAADVGDAVAPRDEVVEREPDLDLYALTWDGRRYVGVGQDGVVATSPDGIDWTRDDALAAFTGGALPAFQYIACSPSACVTMQPFRAPYASTDLTTWTPPDDPRITGATNVCWDGSRFILLTNGFEEDPDDGELYPLQYTSTDGFVWSPRRMLDVEGKPARPNPGNATGFGGLMCAAGRHLALIEGTIHVSSDAITWVRDDAAAAVTSEYLEQIAGTGDRLVAIGGDPTVVVTSTNGGASWSPVDVAPDRRLAAVGWSGGRFVVAGPRVPNPSDPGYYLPRVHASRDLGTWTPIRGEDHRDIDRAVAGGPRIVMYGRDGIFTLEP